MRDMIKKENKLCFQHRMERKTEKSFQLSAGRQRLLAETIRELKQEGRLDEEKLVRGALLHDYFLYDWHQKDPSHRLHGFRHPKTALGNAQRDYYLNWKEKNIIARHMFPLIPVPPQCREAWIVCLADKWCALGETMEPMFHVKHFK